MSDFLRVTPSAQKIHKFSRFLPSFATQQKPHIYAKKRSPLLACLLVHSRRKGVLLHYEWFVKKGVGVGIREGGRDGWI